MDEHGDGKDSDLDEDAQQGQRSDLESSAAGVDAALLHQSLAREENTDRSKFMDQIEETVATGATEGDVVLVTGLDDSADHEDYQGDAPPLRRIKSKPDLPTEARGSLPIYAAMSPASRAIHGEYIQRTRRRRQEQLRDQREHEVRLAALQKPTTAASRLLNAASTRARALMYDRYRRGQALPLPSQAGAAAASADKFAAAVSDLPTEAKLYVEAAAESDPNAPLGQLARTTSGRNPEYDLR